MSVALKGKPHPWNVGKKHSEETRKKLSLNSARRGKPNIRRGIKCSDEVRKRMSIAAIGRPSKLKGIKRSEEFRIKTSLGHMGQIPWNRKKVLCKKDGNIFDRLADAAKFYNIPATTIAEICQGKRKNKDLLIFKYLENTDDV